MYLTNMVSYLSYLKKFCKSTPLPEKVSHKSEFHVILSLDLCRKHGGTGRERKTGAIEEGSSAMAMIEDYRSALRAGQRAYRACVARGQSPYLAVLDDILNGVIIVAQEPLGLVDIPAESIVGT